ncbi:D-alanyl-D-alanine carboxypeptidase/D-alanyl-D-alanine-endopeptidase [Ramlibacter sp.]|uniref:D-alanyl-D-alanine carboxypeptidase/D-alanyl-D-alanine endopeptidase n=1 Tax=Ramlibacter sp. TaxID=1917967 RepID=UPI0018117760|nr:D-alanyl-D-alanine carboxypeptidase/D-alanyl-D-alanine-endopeptidase [Ramlibacter sp.]MBA2672228.1 D-alanyl-D-alanine carboxypeptidase/D-alanyl-D-alanine-endopeptidase [Ramlibacter sp.]
MHVPDRALRRLFAAFVLLWCALTAAAQELPAEVDAALARAKLPRDAVAFYVAPADAPSAPRLVHRIDQPFNPASMAKLVTTYAALDTLGPNFSWATPVYFEGPVQGGVLQGNLYIKGQGDPKLVIERMWLLLRRIHALGVRRVSGDIVLDRGAFENVATDPGAFDGEPLRPYNAAPDALLLNFKSVVLTFTPEAGGTRVQVEPPLAGVQWPASVPLSNAPCGDWRAGLKADYSDPARVRFTGSYPVACGERVWPVAYADPASYAVRAVGGLWRETGGELGGQVREGRVPAALKPVFEWRSPPLAEVVRDINKYSNNVMAEQVFLTLSFQKLGQGSMAASRDVLRAWWRERLGGEPPVLDNGSGLSRTERITARQLAQVLHSAWGSSLMPELMSSLPASGVDGTLRRAGNTGLAHLKTGSLRDVSGVAGYVHGASGRRYVLVAVANHANAAAVRPAIDAMVEWAARDR